MASVGPLADELMDAVFDAWPVDATLLGLPGWEARLPACDAVSERAWTDRLADIGRRAATVDPAGLSVEDGLTRAVILQQAEAMQDQAAARQVEWCVADEYASPVVGLLSTLPLVTIADQAQAAGYLARLAGLPAVLGDVLERHRGGIASGMLPVRRHVEMLADRLEHDLAAADDPLRLPTASDDSAVDGASFAAERDRLVADVVRPALAEYRDALRAEVLPNGRPDDQAGLCWLPGGDEAYERLIRVHTTTDRSAAALHQTGLDVIAALAEEYVEIGSHVFGTTDLAEIWRRLQTDPAMYWRDADELLDAARATIARAEAVMPAWFGRLPAAPCVVAAVPEHDAPGSPAAYYMPPGMDGSRPGTYYANTHRATERERYSSDSTAFHEAVPGHHFQIAIAQELTDLPLLRRVAMMTAYTEGWGLYAERLADEIGLYADPVARLGMLAADSMRAARLVVDTGVHAMGWSRQQVVDYLTNNTVLPDVEVQSETDRYIADPGQALAYMVGRLHIVGIRADAERALGPAFDIRAFHDTVLEHGSLPLDVLGDVVRAWVAGQAVA